MPECADRHGVRPQSSLRKLLVKPVETRDCEVQENIRANFHPAISRCREFVLLMVAECFTLLEVRIEKQRASTGTADVERYNVAVARPTARRRSGTHDSL
jgi:hypothetical protein